MNLNSPGLNLIPLRLRNVVLDDLYLHRYVDGRMYNPQPIALDHVRNFWRSMFNTVEEQLLVNFAFHEEGCEQLLMLWEGMIDAIEDTSDVIRFPRNISLQFNTRIETQYIEIIEAVSKRSESYTPGNVVRICVRDGWKNVNRQSCTFTKANLNNQLELDISMHSMEDTEIENLCEYLKECDHRVTLILRIQNICELRETKMIRDACPSITIKILHSLQFEDVDYFDDSSTDERLKGSKNGVDKFGGILARLQGCVYIVQLDTSRILMHHRYPSLNDFFRIKEKYKMGDNMKVWMYSGSHPIPFLETGNIPEDMWNQERFRLQRLLM